MTDAERAYSMAFETMTIREKFDLGMTLRTEGMTSLTKIKADPTLEEMFIDRMCELAVGRADGKPITGNYRYV